MAKLCDPVILYIPLSIDLHELIGLELGMGAPSKDQVILGGGSPMAAQ